MHDALHVFGATVAALDLELDWALLGRSACDGDGSTFFDAERRERTIDTGLRFAEDVAKALDGARGASLYVGAEVAELPVILLEHLVLGRRVEWINLDRAATVELRRAIRVVGASRGLALPEPCPRAVSELERGAYDHLWMVSVLTDPDAFPALHDELYERAGGPLATGRGVLARDRERAEELVEALIDRAGEGALFTTTDEERRVIEPLAARRGLVLESPRRGRVSAVVGDVVRTSVLTRANTLERLDSTSAARGVGPPSADDPTTSAKGG